MSRNANSHFALNPTTLDIPRSTMNRPHSCKTSFNVGQVIPFDWFEVLPGSTHEIKTSKVVRLQTPLTPFMDNMYLDTYWFFVPNRLVWEHWKQFMGENTNSAWIPEVEYAVPQIRPPEGGYAVGSLADYFGVPTGVDGFEFNALPLRAYALIMNEWFRDQNLQDPLLIPTDDSTRAGTNDDDQIAGCALGGKPFIAAKYHDYFTSCLPSPQKGPDVKVGLAGISDMPVVPLSKSWTEEDIRELNGLGIAYNLSTFNGNSAAGMLYGANSTNGSSISMYRGDATEVVGTLPPIVNNLWAVNSSSANATTINQLRLAFQVQKLYERDARGGSRYREVLKSHFGVTSPDARMMIPEYLGGNRIPINVNQVIQQSATGSGDTPQGTVAGMSLTTDSHEDFMKSFTEHGYVIGLCVARYDHTYQQGLNRALSRKTRFDFYWPAFAHIGEQAVLNKEIFVVGSPRTPDDEDTDNEVFGYQEAWADYRYRPSIVTGEMRSAYEQSLDVWHLADDYTTLPTLSAEWIREDKSNVDRVLAVSSEVSNQLFMDCYIQDKATLPMPMYSIPGLIDHF